MDIGCLAFDELVGADNYLGRFKGTELPLLYWLMK